MRQAGIKVCCGGIIGLGEQADRASLIAELVKLQPESVPINSLVPVPGTVASSAPVDPLDFVRVIAICRITMPRARIRLSAGRRSNWARRCRGCAFWPGRIRFFMAISC